ncbi:unnamed protein product [Camellia sinensis]
MLLVIFLVLRTVALIGILDYHPSVAIKSENPFLCKIFYVKTHAYIVNPLLIKKNPSNNNSNHQIVKPHASVKIV